MNWKILKEPFPFSNSPKKELISSLLFGLFVFLFLFTFQPFGLSNYASATKTLELAGYGMVTSCILLLNKGLFSLLFPKWFSAPYWNVGKNIVYTTYMFFCIGVGNLLYSVWQEYIHLDLNGFIFYQGMTLLVGLFPVTISTFVIYSNRLKKAVKEADGLNSILIAKELPLNNTIEIPSRNKSENLDVHLSNLLSIRAVENYVEVNILENGSFNKSIIRNTLKNVEEALEKCSFIKKCHRSYLVNLQNVKHFKGNAQGLTLNFGDDINHRVAVSRSYVKEIRKYLQDGKA